MFLNPVSVQQSKTIRIILHVMVILLKLKRKQFKNIPCNIQGIFRELKHKPGGNMDNTQEFDFSLIVDDCESSDGQKRHQYFETKETEPEPETIQK